MLVKKLTGWLLLAVACATAWGQQYWDAYLPQSVFTTEEQAFVSVAGVGSHSLRVQLYQVEERKLSFHNLFSIPPHALRGKPVGTALRVSLQHPSGRGFYHVRDIKLPRLPPGVYVVEVTDSRGVSRSNLLWISDIGLVVKSAPPGDTLARVVRLRDGIGVAGAKVAFYAGSRQPLAEVATDGYGIARLPTWSGDTAVVVAHWKNHRAATYLSQGEVSRYLNYLFTDRPVYRPGQRVMFKGIVRERAEEGYRLPNIQQVRVTITDPDNVAIAEQTLSLSENGTFDGEFALPEITPLGRYSIRLAYLRSEAEGVAQILEDAGFVGGFEVQEYRKPEFRLKLEPAQPVYLRGETIAFALRAEYYFGAPVSNARVRYYLYKQYLWFGETPQLEFSIYDPDEEEQVVYGGYGELLARGETTTDSSGRAVIRVPAGAHREPCQYALEVEVTDLSWRTEETAAAVQVYPAAVHLRWHSDRWWLEPGQTEKFTIYARHPRTGQPLRTSVKVSAYQVRWLRTSAGQWRRIETLWWSRTVSTNTQGEAEVLFTAGREGEYLLRASATDSQRRQTVSEYSIGVYTPQYQGESVGARHTIEISLDQKTYLPGQRAKVLLRSLLPTADIWLTVEGRQVYASQVVRLQQGVGVVEIPVTWQQVPNAYICASVVNQKTLIRIQRLLRVIPVGKILRVEVLPNKDRYQPNEEATYTIRTTDEQGNPMPAEVTLSVVDEALYAIVSDTTPDIRRFFWGASPNAVATAISFGREYAAGSAKDSSRRGIEETVRRRFEDVAFWGPTIHTNAQGEAQVRFTMPENLTEWRATARAIAAGTAVGTARAQVKTFKPLLVRLQAPRFLTQGDRCVVTGAVQNYTPQPQQVVVELRVEGSVRLLDQARRQILLPPQGQTTLHWAMDAEGEGEATLTLTASSLQVSDGMELRIPVYAQRVTQTFASAFMVEREMEKSFRLPYNPRDGGVSASVRVAPSWFGVVLGSFEMMSNYPYGCVEQTAHQMLAALGLLEVATVLNINPTDERLTSARHVVQQGMIRLNAIQQPDGSWGYTEYTPGSALWTALAVEALHQAKLAGFAVSPQRLQQGVSALLRLISWISSQPPSLRGLSRSQQELLLGEWQNRLNEKAHALRVAAMLVPQWARVPLLRLYEQRRYLDTSAQCALWFALQRANLPTQATQLQREVLSRAIQTPTTAFWREHSSVAPQIGMWRWYAQDTYATAWVARLLARSAPRSPLLPRALRWLAEKRQGGGWLSTNDTTQAMLAMVEYARQHPHALQGTHRVRLLVNGELLHELTYQSEDWLIGEQVVDIPAERLREGVNTLYIQHLGEGAVAVSVLVRYPMERAAQRVQGLRVERTYLKRVARPLSPSERERLRRRYGDESALLWEARSAREGFQPGDQLLVKLVVHSATDIYYAIVEDPKPAGFEFLERPSDRYEWTYWYSRREVRDDRVSFLSVRIPKGKSVITYVLRAERPGQLIARPAQAFGMYLPEINATSLPNRVNVKVR